VPRLLGVDIDARKVRISAANLRLRTARYLKSGEVSLPDGKEQRVAVLAEVLQQWKKDVSAEGVVVGLPLHYFSCRLLDMPLMARDDLRRGLVFELEKHLPLPVEEYVFDFLMTRGQNGIRTLVFSMKKDMAGAVMKAVTEAGLELVSLRSRTLDVLSSMGEVAGEKHMKGVFINATDDAYELAGIEDAGVVFAKSVPRTADLAEELDAAVLEYPGKVYVSGDIDQRTAEQFAAHKAQISTSFSLLSAYAKKTKLGLEFLPRELVKPKRDYYPYAIGGCAAAAVLFFLLTGFVIYFKDARTLRSIESQINAIKTRASGVIEARKKLDALRDDRKVLVDFQNSSNRAIKALKDLSGTVPDSAWIINLSLDEKGTIEMEGFAKKTSELVMALDKSGLFKSISFAAPIISREGEERFSLKLEVKGQ